LELLKVILPHRDKVGYIAARNTRILTETLTEYFKFKQDLIEKYGEIDKDEEGNELPTISIKPSSANFQMFCTEFEKIRAIEHEVEMMTMSYGESIGVLNGTEILQFGFMLED